MAYVTPPTEIAATRRRRLLINGKSGTRKTTSLLTFPRPIAVLSYPGELGWDSLPDNDPEVYKRVWAEETGKTQDAGRILKTVEDEALAIIASGKYRTVALEGLHHYATLAMDEVTSGGYIRGEEFEPKLYALGYRIVHDHIKRLSNTNIPVIVWTCWAESKAERSRKPGEKDQDIPKKLLPALPGGLGKPDGGANTIFGRFSVMLYQSLKPRKDKAGLTVKNDRNEPVYDAVWQVRPQGDVLCCGLKGPKEIVERIPTFLPADYNELDAAWTKAEKEAAK